jgi:hypothetical protein
VFLTSIIRLTKLRNFVFLIGLSQDEDQMIQRLLIVRIALQRCPALMNGEIAFPIPKINGRKQTMRPK